MPLLAEARSAASGCIQIRQGGWNVTAEHPIRVLLVDDHPVVRSGLELFLLAFPDLQSVGVASNGEEAVLACGRLSPDVVLMDMAMPGMDGATATRAIRSRYPGIRVIALTNFQALETVQKALQAGATSYLLKNVTADELASAIRAAYAGRSILAPEATQALVEAAAQAAPPPVEALTSRELEVLGWMVKGLSNPEIAEHLVISPVTVKFHVGNILSKLGCASRTEAVAVAIQQHLVS
jgi:DNA-binding NarL/FixJ family response regulator